MFRSGLLLILKLDFAVAIARGTHSLESGGTSCQETEKSRWTPSSEQSDSLNPKTFSSEALRFR